MLTPERWQQIEGIFLDAVDIDDPAARARFLTEACGGDAELRNEVEKLIAQDAAAEDEILQPLVERSGIYAFAELAEKDPYIGSRLGNYKILREIGEGGMGTVYFAERADGTFRKQVAVKLIRRGMDTQHILRRFRQERQILAALDHPFITPLVDGGTTDDGLPFFVMEYIEGEPLYDYCDRRAAGIRERLELFLNICRAVEYAHRKRVIHRDLKPSNILIKANGAPHLLDFGIAKVLDTELHPDTLIEPTATAMRMMTPEYASPEQIKGEIVTPLSDVYALGVLLYELLTGARPYRLKNRAPHEIARVICEEEPIAPSALEEKAKRGKTDAENNGFHRVSRSPLLPFSSSELGDLERVILKALRKKPSERYASAAALAEDIANFLENRPVNAESFASSTEPASPAPPTLPEKRSVAILPLTYIGAAEAGESGEAYLGIGLADALILRLSKVSRFIVRPTSSVLRYRAEAVDAFAAGRELGVEFVVEGTVRRAGDRVRVGVRLLSVKDISNVWAAKFDEKFTDVLELEDNISERVARSLFPQLTGEEERRLQRRGTNSPEAYDAYLRGRFFANEFKEDSLMKSIEMYREAIRLDPDYALPHVGIADFYVWAAIFGAIPCHEAYPAAKEELDYALQVDDTLAEAYALKAFVALLYDWNWAQAEALARRALALNPNYYFAHDAFAHVLVSQGIFHEAIDEIRIAEEFDPLSPRAKLITSCVFYQSRHFNDGAAKADEAVAMQNDSAPAFLHLGNSLTHNGRTARAVEVLSASARVWEASALPKYMLCHALVADGRREEAREILTQLLALAEKSYVKPYFVAMSCVALGEIDLAFEWFEKAVEGRDDWMIWFGTDIKLDPLRRDKRYFEILRKTNNPIIKRQV